MPSLLARRFGFLGWTALALISTVAFRSKLSPTGIAVAEDFGGAVASYTMKPPPGWTAADVPSPQIFRCVDVAICGAKSAVVIVAKPLTRVYDKTDLQLLAKILAKLDDSTDSGPSSAHVDVAKGYQTLFIDRAEGGSGKEASAVAMIFAGTKRITVTSAAPDIERARRTRAIFIDEIVIRQAADP